ncbi:MAG: dTMP kinase [Candidatus Hydrogenedentes bacterium]|nr:dTMP kinase [Candidatus Hydrogenedentota bacterium]
MSGLFITFEGIEGCGKSTQTALLKQRIEAEGRKVVVTREPGGTATGEKIRDILLDPLNTEINNVAELLLYAAARAQHIDEVIRPALASGAIVICDRFADSTTAYQGAGRAIERHFIKQAHDIAVRDTWPDLTILMDLPAEFGLERARATRELDRIENEPLAFHRAVRNEFLRIAEHDPLRVRTVDATRTVEELSETIWRIVEPHLP